MKAETLTSPANIRRPASTGPNPAGLNLRVTGIRLAGICALLVSLSSCVTPIVDPPLGPFPGAVALTLGTGADPVRSDEVGTAQTDVYKVTVPADPAATGDLLYFEAVPATPVKLRLTLYNGDGEPVLQSDSADYFGPSGAAQTATRPLTDQAIGVVPICRGPCVLEPAPLTPGQPERVYYLKVEAPADAAGVAVEGVAYGLYLYSDVFSDTGEPVNNDRNTAVSVSGDATGALETLGDEDWYRADTAATRISLASGAAALSLRAEVFFENGTVVSSVPVGTPFTLPQAPQRFLVRVYADIDRAAVAGDSTYTLTFE